MAAVDLNVDAGEGGDDEALLGVATSASLACGGHVGDARSLAPVVALCAARGVTVGAQVSYVDRDGFGRSFVDVEPEVLAVQLQDQAKLLVDLGAVLGYVKPHGALYHSTLAGHAHGDVVRALARELGLPLLLMRGGDVVEGFADRGYGPDGLLLPRSDPGALLEGAAAVEQSLRLAGEVRSICVHSDSPGALETLTSVRQALEAAGHVVEPFA